MSGINSADLVDNARIFAFGVGGDLLNHLGRDLIGRFGSDAGAPTTQYSAQTGILRTQFGQNTRACGRQQAGEHRSFLHAAGIREELSRQISEGRRRIGAESSRESLSQHRLRRRGRYLVKVLMNIGFILVTGPTCVLPQQSTLMQRIVRPIININSTFVTERGVGLLLS